MSGLVVKLIFSIGYDCFKETFWLARSQPTSAACTKVLSDFAEQQQHSPQATAFLKYLDSIPNWQVFHVNEAHANLHMLRSDNIVEGTFSWLINLRYHNCYKFVWMLLEKLTDLHNRQREKATKHTNTLTETALIAANVEIKHAQEYANVSIVDQETGLYVVRHNNQNSLSHGCQVDMLKKSCECTRWEQKGVPCRHAIAVLHAQQHSVEIQHFHKWCLTEEWRRLYDDIQGLYIKLPTQDSVAKARERLLEKGKDIRLVSLQAKGISAGGGLMNGNKRIRSAGESGPSLNSSVTLTAIQAGKKSKTMCQYCSRSFSSRTKHVCSKAKDDVIGMRV